MSNPRQDNVSSTELIPLSPAESDTPNRPKTEKTSEVPLSWTPWPLRKLILAGFGICFIPLAVIVAILFGISKHNWGLTSSKQTLYYLWTYGPTAGLTIVAAFWGQVEYRTKQLMPWKIISVKPAPSEDTLWMDYISSWNVVALVDSLRADH
ncbi:hypothetical protein N7450_003448 [Penicillium hetheringtonii]|uniref:Uncharacterized protein n=1 Tax=Penicillium hetheringtonii TaxID=911720 RepID=A0AAD6DYF4_9EURO|nr:hypothetical protein N7450_003448 [Penicillium hetheringtonii]